MSSKQSAILDIDCTLTNGPPAEGEIRVQHDLNTLICPKYEASCEADEALSASSLSPDAYYTPDEYVDEDDGLSESSQYDSDVESSVDLNDSEKEDEEELHDSDETKVPIQSRQLYTFQCFADLNYDYDASASEEEVYYDAKDHFSDDDGHEFEVNGRESVGNKQEVVQSEA